MMSEKPTIPDIVLEDLVLPMNLLSDESIETDDIADPERSPFKIESVCRHCNCRIRLCCVATDEAIRVFESLLQSEFSFLCLKCSRELLRNGRS
uniref:Protein E7 n=1 Tax=Human papillomavirus TaxID=10566 RepID=A0A385PNN6_9PAPI|nr:MAG: E7 protein [Human papillomavirus]